MERYRLANGADTVDLIEAAARLHHLPPQVVAEAVIAAPRPADRHRLWFPRQNRPGAPDSSYWERSGADTTDRGTVLRVALARTVDISGCARADLQVLDPLHDTLVIEEQQGFDQPFLDFFARVSPATKSACSAARVRGRRVTVADTATDPLFSYAPTREALLAAGSRAVQSTPLLILGRCLGIVSTHHTRPGHTPSSIEETALDVLARHTAVWLNWHLRDTLLNALEHLHRAAGER
ncbi:GAF domain-containing protein [Kitasatospora paranensis]|uniref:GAF domain-containing protein n=1 Tax=Kitasatospora paranensis TaxID=258053 RepID=A0ABW2G1H8_9ACTN